MADPRTARRERAALLGVVLAVACLVADLRIDPPALTGVPAKVLVRPAPAAPR